MSSSRRSSRSTRSCCHPTWRPSTYKQSALASVSLVFAEPEQGAPLISASTSIASTQLQPQQNQNNDHASVSPHHPLSVRSSSKLQLENQNAVQPMNSSGDLRQNGEEMTVSKPLSTESCIEGRPPTTDKGDSTKELFNLATNPSNMMSKEAETPSSSITKMSWLSSFKLSKVTRDTASTNVKQSTQDVPPINNIPHSEPVHQASITYHNPPSQPLSDDDVASAQTRRPPQLLSATPTGSEHDQHSTTPVLPVIPDGQLSVVATGTALSAEVPQLTLGPIPLSDTHGRDSPLPSADDLSLPLSRAPKDLREGSKAETKSNIRNSSNSRFTLNLPVWGSTRVPLDDGSGKEHEQQNVTQSETGEAKGTGNKLPEVNPVVPTHDNIEGLPQNSNIHKPKVEHSESTDVQQSAVAPELSKTNYQSTTTPVQFSKSWWSYLGRIPTNPTTPPKTLPSTSATQTSASLQLVSLPEDENATNPISPELIEFDTTQMSSTKDSTPSKTDVIAQQAQCACTGEQAPSEASAPEGNGVPGTVDSEPSLVRFQQENSVLDGDAKSAGTSEEINAIPSNMIPTSSWFNPWSWQSGSNSITTLHRNDKVNDGGAYSAETRDFDNSAVQKAPKEHNLQEQFMESDMLKEISAKDIGCSSPHGQSSEYQTQETTTYRETPPEPKTNPIEQSIMTNRTGWASFFSSRRLVIKALGYDRSKTGGTEDIKCDDNGMEVMEVDFDGDDSEDAITTDKGDGNKKGKVAVKGNRMHSGDAKGIDDSTVNSNRRDHSQEEAGKQLMAPPHETKLIQSNIGSKGKPVISKPNSGTSTPVPSPTSRSSMPMNKEPRPLAPTSTERVSSPAPSSKKVTAPSPPNLVLPTWENTFYTPPRSIVPPASAQHEIDNTGEKLLDRTLKFVSGLFFANNPRTITANTSGSQGDLKNGGSTPMSAGGKENWERYLHLGKNLPRAWSITEARTTPHREGRKPSAPFSESKGAEPHKVIDDVLQGCRRVVVIGIHGWFPGAVVRTVLGEPTGTSTKFVNMMVQALENFETEHRVSLEKITRIPLEGEGTIAHRVEKLYNNLTANQEWMDDLHTADAIFVVTHSQGSVVSTHLLSHLISDRHIRTVKNSEVLGPTASFPTSAGMTVAPSKPHRVCCLALCGIHLGPLRYLRSNGLVQPYIQYFESSAARELFEFQNTESAVSKSYVDGLRRVLDNGVKMVYVASLNDQVVPIYSGLFTVASHPLILRALYIDGDAYHSSDFLSNLLVLLLRILNSGISDSGLLAHLSEATAGSLNGVGHSTAYEEVATYSLAVKYLFLTDDGLADHPSLQVESFDANQEQNDYEIPWALRDVIADEHVTHFFSREIIELRDAFRVWHPRTAILRELKRKLQPIQRLPTSFLSQGSASKL